MKQLGSKEIISFARVFEAWVFVASHKQLLLRSNPTTALPIRIEILFEDVSVMSIPTWFETLEIREGREDCLDAIGFSFDQEKSFNRRIFILDGGSPKGVVVAREMFWNEDNGSYSDLSPFTQNLIFIGQKGNP
jgi:hypothetical protein